MWRWDGLPAKKILSFLWVKKLLNTYFFTIKIIKKKQFIIYSNCVATNKHTLSSFGLKITPQPAISFLSLSPAGQDTYARLPAYFFGESVGGAGHHVHELPVRTPASGRGPPSSRRRCSWFRSWWSRPRCSYSGCRLASLVPGRAAIPDNKMVGKAFI